MNFLLEASVVDYSRQSCFALC